MIVYIAFSEHPQPQFISELEERIRRDHHSPHPLLLAYGALVTKAPPYLQERMALFLLNRLPLAETNISSLIHHIFSLGNTESNLAIGAGMTAVESSQLSVLPDRIGDCYKLALLAIVS